MDEQNVLCTCEAVLFSLKKEGNSDTSCNMDEPEDTLSEISQSQEDNYCIIPLT